MEQRKIDRINELARRVKAGETLSDVELAERAELRAEYLASVRRNLTVQLESIRVVGPDGKVRGLPKKEEPRDPSA